MKYDSDLVETVNQLKHQMQMFEKRLSELDQRVNVLHSWRETSRKGSINDEQYPTL